MPRRDWRQLVDGLPDVQKLVHLAMRQDSLSQDSIRSELVKTRRREYESSLNELAGQAGCERTALISEGEILTELNDSSLADAESMTNTYNYDLGIAIVAISTETPTANRHIYAKRLQTWDTNRATWKNTQVATNTVLTAKGLAQRDFTRFNTNVEGTARLLGPDPAAEPICQGWLNRGQVPIEVAKNNPSPFHPNCPHSWDFSVKKLGGQECEELWMGS